MLTTAIKNDCHPGLSSPVLHQQVDTSHVKGAGIKAFFEWYSGRGGSLTPAQIGARVDAAAHGWFKFTRPDLGMLSASWYPAPAVHALLDVILAGLSPAECRQLAREGAAVTVRSHLSGLYRFLFRAIMTPKRYAQNADQIYYRYYDSGTLTKEEIAPGRHLTVVRDWPGHHRFLCDLAVFASEVIYPQMGYHLTELEKTSCVSDGDPDCRWLAAWKV